jgi:hypothetical protein
MIENLIASAFSINCQGVVFKLSEKRERAKEMEKMAQLEEEHALSLDTWYVWGLGNPAIKGLVMSIALDSRKHAGLYRTMATLMEEGSLAIPELEADQFEASLRKHIEVEEKMLAEVKALLKDEKDERIKFLLSEIFADERRHHKFMNNLLEVIISRATIPEEDIWNMIWRDVESHGAPPDQWV